MYSLPVLQGSECRHALVPAVLIKYKKEDVSLQECQEASQRLQFNLDSTVDPCEDFYRFACGGFVNKNTIPKDKTSINNFVTLQDKINARVRKYHLMFAMINATFQVRDILKEPKKDSDPLYKKTMKDGYEACMNETRIEVREQNGWLL